MADPSLANSLPSSFVGGALVGGLNYVLTRRKMLAEIDRLELEAQRFDKSWPAL